MSHGLFNHKVHDVCTLAERKRKRARKEESTHSWVVAWRSGSVVGLDQRSQPTLSPVSTGIGDRVRVRLPEAALYFSM